MRPAGGGGSRVKAPEKSDGKGTLNCPLGLETWRPLLTLERAIMLEGRVKDDPGWSWSSGMEAETESALRCVHGVEKDGVVPAANVG